MFATNRTLDHFDVSVAPFLQAFINVDEAFQDQCSLCVVAVRMEQCVLDGVIRLVLQMEICVENFTRNVVRAQV
jgi:hypothetical protein